MDCECTSYFKQKRQVTYLRISIRTGGIYNYQRKQKWVPIGLLCTGCGTIEVDKKWREKLTEASTAT